MLHNLFLPYLHLVVNACVGKAHGFVCKYLFQFFCTFMAKGTALIDWNVSGTKWIFVIYPM